MYDAKSYFTERLERQGKLYVTRAGAPEDFYDLQAEMFLEHIPDAFGRRVLDFGCGVGRLERSLGVGTYLGVDIVPGAIEIARRDRVFPDSRFELIDGSIPTPDGSIDLAVAVTVFQHVPHEEIDRVLFEFGSALAPGARVVIIDSNEQSAAAHMFTRTPRYFAGRLHLREAHAYVVDVDKDRSHWVLQGIV